MSIPMPVFRSMSTSKSSARPEALTTSAPRALMLKIGGVVLLIVPVVALYEARSGPITIWPPARSFNPWLSTSRLKKPTSANVSAEIAPTSSNSKVSRRSRAGSLPCAREHLVAVPCGRVDVRKLVAKSIALKPPLVLAPR